MITLEEYLMGRDVQYPISDQFRENAQKTVEAANSLLSVLGLVRGVRSGYRPKEINAQIKGAAPDSKHMTCQAIDIEDNDGKLKSLCLKNLIALEHLNLWMEAPEATPTWVHVQIISPKSGHRVFIP
jgi:Peptidase M15